MRNIKHYIKMLFALTCNISNKKDLTTCCCQNYSEAKLFQIHGNSRDESIVKYRSNNKTKQSIPKDK